MGSECFMIENETIKHQLNHRAIRAFKDQTLSEEQLTTLYEVARHTATSMFMQQFSILHITDEEKRKQIREITGQKYVGANGDLFIFVIDFWAVSFRSGSSGWRPKYFFKNPCT